VTVQVSLDCEREFDEVGVTDDAEQLAFGFDHPSGGRREHERELTERLCTVHACSRDNASVRQLRGRTCAKDDHQEW
jgi:hypothetical protein